MSLAVNQSHQRISNIPAVLLLTTTTITVIVATVPDLKEEETNDGSLVNLWKYTDDATHSLSKLLNYFLRIRTNYFSISTGVANFVIVSTPRYEVAVKSPCYGHQNH